ncbi:MAG TPA: hypothetical protein VGR89_00080, partial [Puia sp.]|nr:hypothetical protein [Puia sp.]
MKRIAVGLLLVVGLLPVHSHAQLTNGGLYALFGVDADTRTNYLKYGTVTGSIASDDWFAPSGLGNNVIDTTNASIYKTLLQTGTNTSFSQRMSQLLYAKVGGKLWLDAAYGRDYMATAALKDSTTFASASKNGDDPNLWTGGISSVPTKNDLVDVYAHMRRDGLNVHDSLWFFTGIVAYGNSANSYYNVELYKNNFSYDPGTGKFTSAGTSGGHTEWLFDASGNIIQTGDLIVAVSFAPGMVPVVDVRIWVSQSTYSGTVPANFKFGSFSSTSGVYGYTSITSNSGSTAFGAATSNYTGIALQDTTYNTPWGSNSAAAGWSMLYQHAQFIEVGLNMTRIGLDPAMYGALNPCQSLFSNIFFASRSSSSFTSNLQDFVVPLTFLRNPVMDYSVQGDTLRCNHLTGMVTLTDHTTAAYYSWAVAGGGNISAANADSSQLTINKAGTYIVSASPAQGCPTTRIDTIVVPVDTIPPVATAFAGLSGANLDLYGGATVKDSSAFGGSQGINFSWTGPDGFTSTIQNPVLDTVWGTYDLTVTEKRNGCTAMASTDVEMNMFTFLTTTDIQLSGAAFGKQIGLSWRDLNASQDRSYVVERSVAGNAFEAIGEVDGTPAGSGIGNFQYSDEDPASGPNLYRIRAVHVDGSSVYSHTVSVGLGAGLQNIYLANTAGGSTLVVNSGSPETGE